MSSSALVAAVLIGVLLPLSVSRPRFLESHRMRDHIRRRWNYAYTCGAFTAMGYVYIVAIILLKPTDRMPPSDGQALGSGALILIAIALAHHVPPLLVNRRSRFAAAIGIGSSVLTGLVIGGSLAVSAVFFKPHHPAVSQVWWAVLLLVTTGSMFWFSGLSPESSIKFTVYRERLAGYAKRARRSRS